MKVVEVSIATINDPFLSNGHVTVFAGDVDMEHTVFSGPLALYSIVWDTSRKSNQTITGHIGRDTLGLCMESHKSLITLEYIRVELVPESTNAGSKFT